MVVFENADIMIERHEKDGKKIYYIIDKANLNNTRQIIITTAKNI